MIEKLPFKDRFINDHNHEGREELRHKINELVDVVNKLTQMIKRWGPKPRLPLLPHSLTVLVDDYPDPTMFQTPHSLTVGVDDYPDPTMIQTNGRRYKLIDVTDEYGDSETLK
jgi:hypothetical protein